MTKIFAETLKNERQRLGLTQAEAATLLGVSHECVSKWERGLSVPSAITQEGALARLKSACRREKKPQKKKLTRAG